MLPAPVAGRGAPGNDGGNADAATEAGSTDAGRTRDAASPDAGPANDAGQDGGADASVGCTVNPDSAACPEVCSERCNGADDDCDGEIDEAAAVLADCRAEHAVTVCEEGECRVVECRDDYRDCDDDPATGCEVALEDPAHCGQCNRACDLLNAVETCSSGTCVVAECVSGFGDCDQDGRSCEQQLVGLDNCGGCNQSCGGLSQATPQCDTGSCGVQACLGNFGDCNRDAGDGCETSLDSLAHCGDCDAPCAKASCAGGVCTAVVCEGDAADCDLDEIDCEVDLGNDVAHCGGCNRPCAFQAVTPHATLGCAGRECQAACDSGYGDCDENYATGCETTLANTPPHCGGCGNNCTAMLPHTATTSCTAGACGVVSCASGWADCDTVAANGCERNTTAEGPCFPDTNCTRQTYAGHDYYFCTNASNWTDARARCRLQARGDLAGIGSSGENAFVTMYRTADAWLGARDAAIEGLWRWENSGMPFFRGAGAGGSAQLSQYESFVAPQPDDYNAAEDCAELRADGTWNDTGCGNPRAFVCEVGPDACPSDASKIDPGQCGCGMPDTDTDSDGFADCVEDCDTDPSKQSAGVCGCGVADTESDGDAVPDCNDGCPSDPTETAACLGFTPTNFTPRPVNWSAQPISTLNCGTTTVNTTDPDGAGAAVATITNWCGTPPTPIVQMQTQPVGPDVAIIPLRGLSIPMGNTLRVIGNRPVILAIDGDVSIAGTVDVSASGVTPGAGGNVSCGTSQGGNGSGDPNRFEGASGGGGGGFRTAGGRAGTADTDGSSSNGGIAGIMRGSDMLSPLLGGCAGGQAGGCGTAGGAGGGALQITASGTLAVSGTLRANGAAGATPCGGNDEGGGTGGGSGGAIRLEAASVNTAGSTLQVNGGNGGANGNYAGIYNCGGTNGGAGSTSAANPGVNGSNCQGGSPGGGGGYGWTLTVTR